MRRALLALAILIPACEESPPDEATGREVCVEAFECVLSECEYPTDAIDALGPLPDCSGLGGDDAEMCWAEIDAWLDAKSDLIRPFGECMSTCQDPDRLDETHAGVIDANDCASSEDPDACEAPSCEAF